MGRERWGGEGGGGKREMGRRGEGVLVCKSVRGLMLTDNIIPPEQQAGVIVSAPLASSGVY